MSTQERPEENELAALLQKTGPFFEEYGNRLLLGLSAILLVAAVWIYVSRSGASAKTAGWSEMNAASSAEDFHNIAEAYPDLPVGEWARLSEADALFRSGIQLTFTDRASSKGELEKAVEVYETVIAKASVTDLVRQKALFGKAQCVETLCTGDTADAKGAWQKLIDAYPDTTMAIYAQERIGDLDKPESAEFYAWFSKQDPKPTDIQKPQDSAVGTQLTLPDTPELLQLPETPMFEEEPEASTSETPAEEEKAEPEDAKPAEPEDAKPAEPEDDKPAESKPESAAKPEEKPVTEEKPATEEKAATDKTEKPAEPAKAESTEAQPEPAKTEPEKTEPAKSESAEAEPAKTSQESTEKKPESDTKSDADNGQS